MAALKKDTSSKEISKNPTALIAGGAGFIGSQLCATLVSQNFHVICVDNLSSGKKENIKDILTSPNFTFIEADINNPNFALPEGIKIDYCFHLASSEQYQSQDGMSLDTLLVNSLGTRQLLEITKANSAKFILTSSADLYSGAISSSSLRYYFGKGGQGEAVLGVHEAKRFAEALSFEYFKKFNLEVTILRLKDVYGPKMNLDRGDEIADLLNQAAKKETLKIAGDGLKTINPTYVSDVIFGMVKASLGDFSGEIFLLVNPAKVTVESFAQTVKLVAGPLEIEHKKANDTLEIPASHLDLDNTKEKISWNPKVSLSEGISGVIQSLRMTQTGSQEDEFSELETSFSANEAKTNQASVETTGRKTRSKLGLWIRLTIFLGSLLLLIVAVVYPLGATSLGGYLGKNSLAEASKQLQSNDNQQTIKSAESASSKFKSAEKNLANIYWLLKMIGVAERAANFDHLLDSADKISQGFQSTARANQIVVDTSETENLTKTQASANLNRALDQLYASQESLEETQLILETINWNTLPGLIAPERTLLYESLSNLQKQDDELINAINNILGKSTI